MSSTKSGAEASSTRVRQPELRRVQLLEAARALFAAKGFEATTTAEIARRAGMSEGVLFHQFGTKRRLYDQLAEDYGRDLASFLALDADTEPTEDEIVRGAFKFAENNPRLYQLFAITGPKADQFGTTPMSATLVAAIEARLTRDIANGSVRPGDTHVMAEIQYAIVDTAYRTWSRNSHHEHQECYINEAIHTMRAILAPQS